MKKVITQVLIITLLLASCNANPSQNDSLESSSISEPLNTPLLLFVENNWDIYTSGEQTDFTSLVLVNPVDKAYVKNYPDTGVTHDMIIYEAKFADIWKKEMEFSIQNLAANLNDEDNRKLISIQGDWLELIMESMSFEQNLLVVDEYGVQLGSLFLVFQRTAYKNAFRTRTFQIKYIHFLLETQGDNPKSINDCDSLKFLFNE